ncbi:MAG TPA: ABC transporter ATP-binding protein [Candidatus Aminicenantes bacterium]|nr:ABC transporter ATP-binding protein [Candidatus Aminicenantes bacterium]
MDLVVAERITKDYVNGKVSIRALDDVSFRVGSGAFVSFVGPSGSGKTTLLNLIGCLDRPTSGRLRVAGTDVAGLDRLKGAIFRGRHLGFIFQDFNLIPVLTVAENVEYPLIMVRGVEAGRRRDKVARLVEAVGMAAERDKFPDQLSGGQKQRVAIARALVTEPDLVLADEPTANLDSHTAGLIIHLMKSMKDTLGTTFIFSTHDMRIVDEADVVHTLRDGALVESSAPGAGVGGESHA